MVKGGGVMFYTYIRLFVQVLGRGVSTIQCEKLRGVDDDVMVRIIREQGRVREGKDPIPATAIHDIGLIKVSRGGNGRVCIEDVDSFVYTGGSEFIDNARTAWIKDFKEQLEGV